MNNNNLEPFSIVKSKTNLCRSFGLYVFLILSLSLTIYFIIDNDIQKVKQTSIKSLGDISISSQDQGSILIETKAITFSYSSTFFSLFICDCDFSLKISQKKDLFTYSNYNLHSSNIFFDNTTSSCISLSSTTILSETDISFSIQAGELVTSVGNILDVKNSVIDVTATCNSVKVYLGNNLLVRDIQNVVLASSTISTEKLRQTLEETILSETNNIASRRHETIPEMSSTFTREFDIRYDLASYLTQALRLTCGLIASTSKVLFPSKMIGFEASLTLENQQLSQSTTDISSFHIIKSRTVINSDGVMDVHVRTYFSEALTIVFGAIKPALAQSIATGLSQLITGETSSNKKDPLTNVMNSLSSSILSLFGQETSLSDPIIVASLRVICDQGDGSSVCGSIAKSLHPSSSSSSYNDFSYNSHIAITSSTSSTTNPSKESPRNLQNIPKHTLTVSPLGLIFDTSGMIIATVDSLLQVEGSGKNVFLDTAIANAHKIVRDSNYTLSAKLDTSTIVDPNWYRYTYNNSTNRYVYDNQTIISSTTCGTVNLFLRGKQRTGQTVTVGVNAQLDATNVYSCIHHLLKEYSIIPPVSSAKRDLFVTYYYFVTI